MDKGWRQLLVVAVIAVVVGGGAGYLGGNFDKSWVTGGTATQAPPAEPTQQTNGQQNGQVGIKQIFDSFPIVGGPAIMAGLGNVWNGGNLTEYQEGLLQTVFEQFPLGQTNFNTWLKQTLRQTFNAGKDTLISDKTVLEQSPTPMSATILGIGSLDERVAELEITVSRGKGWPGGESLETRVSRLESQSGGGLFGR